ncbi:MAG: SUMF1/EgtB/PvdO family nonheme iron enzyme [Hyphomonadaceae bacterium]
MWRITSLAAVLAIAVLGDDGAHAQSNAMTPEVCAVSGSLNPVFWTRFNQGVAETINGVTPQHAPSPHVTFADRTGGGRAVRLTAFGALHYAMPPASQTVLAFGAADFALSVWVNLAPHNGVGPILDTRVRSGADVRGVFLFSASGNVGFQIMDGAGHTNWIAQSNIANEQWRHIAVTVDRDADQGGRIYVDGVLVHTFDPRSRRGSLNVGTLLNVGHDTFSNAVGVPLGVDEIEIYNRVLTPAELAQLAGASRCTLLNAGVQFDDCSGAGWCPRMVVLPAGAFLLGSPASEPGRASQEAQTPRTIARFAVGVSEVTFDQWTACAADGGCQSNPNPSDGGWGRQQRPVINISWNDAKNYVAWLTARTGESYRLLSESEWEYAARGGTTTRYHFGPYLLASQASYRYIAGLPDSLRRTQPVRSYPANAFGLHDVHGNVWEWVEDCPGSSGYSAQPSNGAPVVAQGCTRRALRGGSWDSGPDALRSATRGSFEQAMGSNQIGLRVARELD